MESSGNSEELANLRRMESIGAFHGILARSTAMMAVFRKIELYSPAEAPLLISGETGTGKELVARAVHAVSNRKTRPFVALNCTALNEELFESELFGHERGAFTGANRLHKGRFERADHGTLFLDEIGDMSLRVQAKLLRALEEGVIERVGAEAERKVDVRVVAATNVSLDKSVAAKRFRADLFHRIAVFRIHIPPLRDRKGDIPLLAHYFLRALNKRYGREVKRITPEGLRFLEDYSWPGNVRELRNVLERVYVESGTEVIGRNAFAEWERERDLMAAGAWNIGQLEQRQMAEPMYFVPGQGAEPGGVIPADRLPFYPAPGGEQSPGGVRHPLAPVPPGYPPPEAAIDVDYIVEKPLASKGEPLTERSIREAFARAKGNATEASRLLGRHKTTLYRNMKRLGLTREDLEKTS